jgi:hypothetical protein
MQLKTYLFVKAVYRGAFWQFPFRWIYYCHSSKSTGKEAGKMHLYCSRGTRYNIIAALDLKLRLQIDIYNLHGLVIEKSNFYFWMIS